MQLTLKIWLLQMLSGALAQSCYSCGSPVSPWGDRHIKSKCLSCKAAAWFLPCLCATFVQHVCVPVCLQYGTSDNRDDDVMEAFKSFLLDTVPMAGAKRNRAITSLLWWDWANSPDSGSLTAAVGDEGEFKQVIPDSCLSTCMSDRTPAALPA